MLAFQVEKTEYFIGIRARLVGTSHPQVEVQGAGVQELPPVPELQKTGYSLSEESTNFKQSEGSDRRNARGEDSFKGDQDISPEGNLVNMAQTSKESEPKVTVSLSDHMKLVKEEEAKERELWMEAKGLDKGTLPKIPAPKKWSDVEMSTKWAYDKRLYK
uniref:Uncharacterized protein n=1 Tax=Physcomitrium patens TaxID=3218 RepID=A0A2K1J391_PHYPA|nr:hypothetical protein PHYPA_021841 [Physcomitrium patens]